ncbi:MAG: ABC transporter permease [Sphaerobacter sp.]|nr:ABC transporter permease [Sphaerobacter sp.]
MDALLAQARMELTLTLRRAEGVLITMIVPIVLLIFFASIGLKPEGYERPIDFLLPGMLALAVMSSGLVSLSIRTAYERSYGVLKRLGSTPLSRPTLIGAKVLATVLIQLVEIVLLIGIASVGYGWRPSGSLAGALLALVLGTVVFAGLGLLMAGALRAETTLALANALYLLFLLLGGIVWPVERLPGLLSLPARLLPSSAFADALRQTLGAQPALPWLDLLILAGWSVLAIVLASRTFRWE